MSSNKKRIKLFFNNLTLLIVGRAGFEPTKALPTDLQSAPFDRFGIFPNILSRISDSNWGPRDYKSRALANWANSAFVSLFNPVSTIPGERLFSKTAAQSKELIFYFATFFKNFQVPFLLSKKVGKLPVSHRYNRLPLLPSDPGGIQQELVAQDLPGAKV